MPNTIYKTIRHMGINIDKINMAISLEVPLRRYEIPIQK